MSFMKYGYLPRGDFFQRIDLNLRAGAVEGGDGWAFDF